MSVEERMANFMFLYDDDGPHLNPHIMEKLKPEPSIERDQEREARLHPDLSSVLVDPVSDPTAQISGSTSAVSPKEMPHPQVRSHFSYHQNWFSINYV